MLQGAIGVQQHIGQTDKEMRRGRSPKRYNRLTDVHKCIEDPNGHICNISIITRIRWGFMLTCEILDMVLNESRVVGFLSWSRLLEILSKASVHQTWNKLRGILLDLIKRVFSI